MATRGDAHVHCPVIIRGILSGDLRLLTDAFLPFRPHVIFPLNSSGPAGVPRNTRACAARPAPGMRAGSLEIIGFLRFPACGGTAMLRAFTSFIWAGRKRKPERPAGGGISAGAYRGLSPMSSWLQGNSFGFRFNPDPHAHPHPFRGDARARPPRRSGTALVARGRTVPWPRVLLSLRFRAIRPGARKWRGTAGTSGRPRRGPCRR